jgi:hypothetical protein
MEISIEQEFSIHAFAARIEKLNEEELKTLLVSFYTYDLLKDKAYQELLAYKWGIEEQKEEVNEKEIDDGLDSGWEYLLF